tara:strand:- start:8289 stop:9185 length:897 start_codon:yes stop_codon:yes gene_type:complete
MKLAICLLSYNRKEELQVVLSSIYYLLNKEIHEIILLDQGSNDGSRDMIANQYPLVKLKFINKNLGVAGGRDFLIKNSNSEICVFLDDDSYFKNTQDLLKISDIFKNHNYIKFTSFKIININNELADWPHPRALKKKCDNEWRCLNFVGCGHAIRKDAYLKVGGYNTLSHFYAEELELTYKLFNHFGSKMGLHIGNIEVIHLASPKQRLHWSGKRLEYRVKNRISFYLQNFSYFSPFTFLIITGFIMSDMILAFKNKNIKGFLSGLNQIRAKSKNRMNLINSINYQCLYFKLLFGYEI